MVTTQPSTVLFLAANPLQVQPLQLGEECRAIEDKIRAAKYRDRIRFRSRWAARPDDLLQALNEDTPSVLHFSGHGAESQGLCFQSENGDVFCVSAEGLDQVMQAAGASVTLVVLNACFSEVQARALVAHIPCVIGMSGAIDDEAAIIYAGAFYRALAFGKSVANAHAQGLAALALHSTGGQARDIEPIEAQLCLPIPKLLTRRDTDADRIHIVTEPAARRHCELHIKATLKEFDADVIARVTELLREITGDLYLEITDVKEGSVRLMLSLSHEAARKLMQLRENGQLNEVCGFEVCDVYETSDPQQRSTEITRPAGQSLVAAVPLHPTIVPALTIVYHPELRRIGDRVVLGELATGHEARISRIAPRFAPPRQPRDAPLNHHRLSRMPFVLRPRADGGVILDPHDSRTRITVDGDLVNRPRELSPEQLQRGVLLELSERILLLLHMFALYTERDTDDLGLIGHSDHITRVRDDIRRIAGLDVPVLIRGETGTGKELVATTIHTLGRRARGPLVCVNMATLSPALAAAELFGASRGAFMSARGQDGYFRAAAGGTLFLDGIGAAPPEIQILLLRSLETSEVYSLGTERAERVDVRIIAATDDHLEALIERGALIAPLLHRLAGYEIYIPPLRERRDDIARLLLHFLGLHLAETGDTDLLDRTDPAPWLPLALTRRLMQHHWPGNVRQLCDVVRQLVISSRGDLEASLSPTIFRQLTDTAALVAEPPQAPAAPKPRNRKLAEITKDEFVEALRAHRWDIKSTAAALGISRTSLYKLMEASQLTRTAGQLDVDEIRTCHRELGGDIDAMAERLRVSKPALQRRIQELGLS